MKYCLLALFALSTFDAMAQQQSITRIVLGSAMMEQNVTNVEIQEITLPPGQMAPRHMHPCPVVGYIRSGQVLFQIEGKEPHILKEGDSFYEPKNVTILHFDNIAKDQPLTFIAFYLKEGQEEDITILH